MSKLGNRLVLGVCLHQWFLTGGGTSRGARAFTCSTTCKVLNGNAYLPNITPVLILRRYMSFGLLPAEIEVRVNFLDIL